MTTKNGKQVYIAWKLYDYYGTFLLGVYTTHAKAKARCEKHCRTSEHNKTSDYVEIVFKDSGIGFTEVEKGMIFKKFGKIERTDIDNDIIIEGSGLGLFISKQIVELHGGNIWVESEGRNKGSSFTIRLPINEKK